ncbi:hypothetical protein HYPSUDRAFT_208513 [Hypholoma sublateritium FD-334 SS-4]|uniref:Uncharacterized protein n=1 Tax=Hypholoma sublateritium (strain FD-334 SS-4) TaxID=945553 RepID=A0A0D2P2D2_HYPSF|nr:hypothetical protein HYPSUDRAFT_208513 [Hypholoma sublateritium FD-334 SS-4]
MSYNHVTPTHKRIVNNAYVSILPSPWSTLALTRKTNGSSGKWQASDDLGGYESQDDGPSSPSKRSGLSDSVKSSARRTGDRYERGLEKLTSLIEDVFEAEDTLSSEMEASDLNHFFSALSVDLSRPMLAAGVVCKLTKYIGPVARPTKRLRQATGGVLGTPRERSHGGRRYADALAVARGARAQRPRELRPRPVRASWRVARSKGVAPEAEHEEGHNEGLAGVVLIILILYPFVEGSAEGSATLNISPLLVSIVKNAHSMVPEHRGQLCDLFVALSAVISRINNLVNTETVAMSDSIIIQAVYIAIGPLFVVDLREERDALAAARRAIFANHEDQRSWIIEDLLASLIKLNDTKQKAGQYRLDVRIEAKKIEKTRQNSFALKRQESFSESQQAPPEPFLDGTDLERLQH